ncbi:MAG TPA: ferredoxin--NADP reductase [Burkholderiales bacterium]|nr:ferredoxin--NADP reductase [Burkholderiales bacterium]
MSTKFHACRVIENRHWTDTLFSLRVEGPGLKFEAGQFVRIGIEPTLVRAFSFVNPPEDPVLEFYGVVVPHGPLSPRLARLEKGDVLQVASNPAGFLVLSEVPDAEALWLVSSGTGIAPFLSILRTQTPWRRFRNVVLVHAVRYAREFAYKDLITTILQHRPGFRYVTFVSREAASGSLAGRIPAAIRDGRLEAAAGVALSLRSHVMLCGNPQMLKDATAALAERGMRKHRRRNPGHIAVESFW